jgi:hypothetical protein
MNTKYLKQIAEEIKKIWTSKLKDGHLFFQKLREVTRFYKTYCKQKACESQKREEELQAQLETAQRDL